MTESRILGISPGTKTVGLALLHNRRLTDWKMQTFPFAWSVEKSQSIVRYVEEYVNRNNVTAVAVKIPDLLPVSLPYIQLVGSLNVLFESKGILPMYFMLSDLKRQYCPHNKVTKAELFASIVDKYPDLLPEHHMEHTNLNTYYARIFEAVGVAEIGSIQQSLF